MTTTIIIREVKAKYGEEKEVVDAVMSPYQVYKFFDFLKGEVQEQFCILCLDSQNKPLAYSKIALGSDSEVNIHPRDIFRNALLSNAHSIILVHNHPSNYLKFSFADYEITKRMVEVGKLLGVTVIDHILATDYSYISMKEAGGVDF